MSFSDQKGDAFSANFATEDQLFAFVRHLMVTVAHIAKNTDAAEAGSEVGTAWLTMEAKAGNDDGATASPGDTCGVTYSARLLTTAVDDPPQKALREAPFSDNGGDVLKLKADDTSQDSTVPGLGKVTIQHDHTLYLPLSLPLNSPTPTPNPTPR